MSAWIAQLERRALIAGVALLALGVVGRVLVGAEQFFRSYLIGFVFWLGIPFGCLGIQMMHALTGGRWGPPIRRTLYAASTTLPLFALLLLPIFGGMQALYPWARPEAASDALIQHKAAYLNTPFFIARGLACVLLWSGLAWLLYQRSLSRIRDGREATAAMRVLSGPGLLVCVLTMSVCAIDWLMTLEPHWFSTMFPVIVMVGMLLSALCFAITLLLMHKEKGGEEVNIDELHDLGNLLLVFVMLWAYVSFSQYLIIYAGNMAEDVSWYVHRQAGGWEHISLGLIILHFAVPFLVLVSRRSKRSPRLLRILAPALLAMRLIEVFWITAPNFYQDRFHVHWMDVVIPLGIGGLWIAAFLRRYRSPQMVAPTAEGAARA